VPSELYRHVDGPAPAFSVAVNGKPWAARLDGGYAVVDRSFAKGDVVTLELPMPVRRVAADERVTEDRGKVALERGPLVYGVEAVDNGGSALELTVPDDARFEVDERPELLGGVRVLRAAVRDARGVSRTVTAIPYYAWSHRGPGEMAVWLKRAPAGQPGAAPRPSGR
jgi:DUF1680 family protein